MAMELSSNVIGSPEKYLDIQLFEDAVEYALRECAAVQIEKVSIEAGSSYGENYLGLIYRAKVSYRRGSRTELEQMSLIVKCIPNTPASKFLHEANVFLKEKKFYRDVLPLIELFCSEKEKFGAKFYNSMKTPLQTLVFEDLKACGYNMASREAGLDETHCSVVLRKLGKFHALSRLLAKRDVGVMNCFNATLVSETNLKESNLPYQYYSAQLLGLEAVLRTWPGYETIADKIRKYAANMSKNLLRSVAPMASDVQVLNHGDLWVNNVLFKYRNDGKPSDVVFVDFQMSIWGSLGLDLNYFFNSSVQLQVLQERRQHLLHLYYESLSATLAAHGCLEIPTFEQVQQEVRRREAWGFFAAFAIFPMISLDKEAASDNSLTNLADKEFTRRKIEQMYLVERVQQQLRYSLKRFDELGVFD